jgi:inosine-uridine nucleoside N-ribohydrolase
MEHVIVDTDPGIDDAAALFFLLGAPADVSVDLVTTVFGNVHVAQATRNARRLLHLAGRPDIPVREGAPKPLRGSPAFATHMHGRDGLGDLDWPEEGAPPADADAASGAAAAILEHAARHPGELTLLALGPLTNVALALAQDPSLGGRLRRIICMGGAVMTMGNASPVASANFFNDPWAAAVVYESGAPLVQVGLDVCQKVPIADAQIAQLAAEGGPPGRRLAQMSRFIRDAYQRTAAPARRWSQYGAGPWVHFNDVPAAAYLLLPDAFTVERLPVVIETAGLCRGQTVADFRGQLGREPNVSVCLDVDGARIAEVWLARVAGLGRAGDGR